MNQTLSDTFHNAHLRITLLLAAIAAAWFAVYHFIQPLSGWITYDLLRLQAGSHLGESIAFFLYDVPKILLLLSGMIFLISIQSARRNCASST